MLWSVFQKLLSRNTMRDKKWKSQNIFMPSNIKIEKGFWRIEHDKKKVLLFHKFIILFHNFSSGFEKNKFLSMRILVWSIVAPFYKKLHWLSGCNKEYNIFNTKGKICVTIKAFAWNEQCSAWPLLQTVNH